jgi:hypothetical protein
MVQLAEMRQEERTREVAYTVLVPKEVERQFAHVVHKPVVEEKVVTFTEMVPETVERTVQVPETIVVARQIQIELPGETIVR